MTTVPQGALFRARTHISGRAARRMSRTRRDDMATLKPPSPLRPKTAPKTSISHSQRRWRFQLAHLTCPQRRQRFQTTGAPSRQDQTAAPVGSGEAWMSYRWPADVTNVVKPARFKSPHEDSCYKRRQSKPKNHHFQPKSHRIDDVCNNGSQIHTKNTSD